MLVAVAIHTIASAAREQVPEEMQIVVAARAIESGKLLDEDDVTVASIPQPESGQVAPFSADPHDFIGKHAVAAVPEGGPLYREQLLDETLLDLAPEGTVITAVPIADNGALEIMTVGSRIQLYAPPDEFAEDQGAQLVADDVLVVGKAVESGASTFLSDVDDTIVFHVAIPRSIATLVIGIGARAPFHAVLATA